MSGRHPWNEIAAKIKQDPVRQVRVESGVRASMVIHELAQLRENQGLTQTDLAKALHVTQARISRLEGQEDVYLSTLRDYIAAMGGELHVIASFPEGIVELGAVGAREEALAEAD